MNFDKNTTRGAIAVLFLSVMLIAFSWLVTCGLVKLITLCFGLVFSWPIATGIWLIMILLRSIFKNTTTVKK